MNTSHTKRSKKPKPLFGLFRSKNSSSNGSSPIDNSLGSGISTAPLNSLLSPKHHDPYFPLPPKPSTSTDMRKSPPTQQRRQRSKSVGRDPSTINNTSLRMLLEERENALNKLCKRDTTSTSLVDSLPLLSPTYHKSPPPVPPIPLHHQQQPSMRKFSSAHDLRKAARLQQESIQQTNDKPVPKLDLSRSRSLSSSAPRLQASKSQQQLKSPTTPTRRRMIQVQNDSDDDDIPLGYLQSPISKPSSLLNDLEEDDDKDLIPIAAAIKNNTSSKLEEKKEQQYQTAADKYKERVKERLQFNQENDDDDDDVPISLALLSLKDKTKKWKK